MEKIRRATHAGSWYTDNCKFPISLICLNSILCDCFRHCFKFDYVTWIITGLSVLNLLPMIHMTTVCIEYLNSHRIDRVKGGINWEKLNRKFRVSFVIDFV
jgi:hypothetical protein